MPEVYQSTKVLQDVKLSKPRPKSKLREMKSMKILKNKVKLDEQINDFVNPPTVASCSDSESRLPLCLLVK